MSIYDKTKMICRSWIEVVNNLFNMGKDLETEVDGMKGGIVKDVTLTEVDKHYTLTILYDDGTSDTVNWDDSTVGIEDITMTYQDGVYILTITLTDGTRYTFSIPVGDIVTQQELTALNLGTPDDTASSTGSLWGRVKDAVTRITTNEGNITTLQSVKANISDVYSKLETYNKTEIDAALLNKADKKAMVAVDGYYPITSVNAPFWTNVVFNSLSKTEDPDGLVTIDNDGQITINKKCMFILSWDISAVSPSEFFIGCDVNGVLKQSTGDNGQLANADHLIDIRTGSQGDVITFKIYNIYDPSTVQNFNRISYLRILFIPQD